MTTKTWWNELIAGTAGDVTQIGNVVVAPGDFEGLVKALTGLGIPRTQTEKLKGAINADHKGFGQRTKEWVVKAAATVEQSLVRRCRLPFTTPLFGR